MSDLIFIDVKQSKGLVSSTVDILQLTAIGAVARSETAPVCWIYAPRDLEDSHILRFESEGDCAAFVERLLRIIGRKATLVVI